MTTVHEKNQVKGCYGSGMSTTSFMVHGDIHYSPLNNTGVIMDFMYGRANRTVGIAFGRYKTSFITKENGESRGAHFDIYLGYRYTDSMGKITNLRFSRDNIYSFKAQSFLLQAGAHLKGELASLDLIVKPHFTDIITAHGKVDPNSFERMYFPRLKNDPFFLIDFALKAAIGGEALKLYVGATISAGHRDLDYFRDFITTSLGININFSLL